MNDAFVVDPATVRTGGVADESRKPLGVRTCATCGRPYEQRWGNHKYCSAGCWPSERRKRKAPERSVCASCGKAFLTTRGWQRRCPACRGESE